MSESQKDTRRAFNAAKAILDERDPAREFAKILITLDHTIAAVLLMSQDRDVNDALAILHEGIVPQVEERLMLFALKQK